MDWCQIIHVCGNKEDIKRLIKWNCTDVESKSMNNVILDIVKLKVGSKNFTYLKEYTYVQYFGFTKT